MEEIVSELRENRHDSVNLNILIREANTKENLLKWVKYFEKQK
jgi:hypothetical protein